VRPDALSNQHIVESETILIARRPKYLGVGVFSSERGSLVPV